MITISKYTPFATLFIATRYFCFSKSGYSFRFNGKEDELSVNLYDLGERFFDARLARMLSLDPLMFKYPFWSPYSYANNSPVLIVDLNGAGPGPQDGADKMTISKNQSSLWAIAKKAYKTYGKEGGQTFSSYWKNIQNWNKGRDLSQVGSQAYVEDPQKAKKFEDANEKFLSNEEVKPSTTFKSINNGSKLYHTMTFNSSYKELLASSLNGVEVAMIDGKLLEALSNDPKINERAIYFANNFTTLSNGDGFYYTEFKFTFGSPDLLDGGFELSGWVMRNCTVKAMVTKGQNSIMVKFRAEDIFDLYPNRTMSSTISFEQNVKNIGYNIITGTLYPIYHGFLNANENMQTRATFSHEIFK
jgi:RHS repeat-associated protein